MRLQRDLGQIWWNFLTSHERQRQLGSHFFVKNWGKKLREREREREREVKASQRSFGLLKGT